MQTLAPIIRDLAVILGTAGVVTLLFQKIHQPVVLGYLVAGMIVGPYTPPHALVFDVPNIKIIAELGVIFLMFSLGLEFSFHKLIKVGFSALVTGIFEVFFLILIGFTVGKLLGWSYYDSVFLGAALSISSTTIIIKALEELKLKQKNFAHVVFGILIVEDLLAILLLVGLSTIGTTSEIVSWAMLISALKLFTVVLSWFLIGYFLVPSLFRRIMDFANSETLTIVSIALCLILVVIAVRFDYSTALGAFIMGSILAETPQHIRIIELIEPIRDIFGAVFFVSVGMLIDPLMIVNHWSIVLIISGVTILSKIFFSGVAAFGTGQSFTNALRIGFSMAQIGEFSFIIISLGTVLKIISVELYAIIVAVSAITTFTTPYLIRLSSYLTKKFNARVPDTTKKTLNRYSLWIYERVTLSEKNKKNWLYCFRFIINGFLIAIIFIINNYLFLPGIGKMAHIPIPLLDSFVWLISFILSSPFIWSMMFYHRHLSFFTGLAFLLTVLELSALSIGYFYSWWLTGALVVIAILIFVGFFNQLKTSYDWFENKLIYNLGIK